MSNRTLFREQISGRWISSDLIYCTQMEVPHLFLVLSFVHHQGGSSRSNRFWATCTWIGHPTWAESDPTYKEKVSSGRSPDTHSHGSACPSSILAFPRRSWWRTCHLDWTSDLATRARAAGRCHSLHMYRTGDTYNDAMYSYVYKIFRAVT
jgi:hypothetical protein